MLVGACIAGPPTVRGQILGSAGTANAGRASPAPTMKSRNSAYNQTHLSRFIVGVGLCSTRKALRGHKVLAGEQCSPLRDEIAKAHIILHKPESYACRGLHRRPANGAACFCYSRSSPIRAKTFPYNKKRPASVSLAGLISWCIISGSVQKTVQCTVFSDRIPAG